MMMDIRKHFKFSEGTLIIVLITILLINGVHLEKILFFNGYASHSHLVAMEPLANALADRGHEVTIVTPMTSSGAHPNITFYCPTAVLSKQNDELEVAGVKVIEARMESKYKDYILQSGALFDGQFGICREYYLSGEFQGWIKNSKFDLIVIDSLARECGLALVYLFGAKSIIFSPHGLLHYDADTYGWPVDPKLAWSFLEHPTLPESFQNEWMNLFWYFMKIQVLLPRYDAFFHEEMKMVDMPLLGEIERNSSLILVNIHYSYEFAHSLPPFVIPIGGMHCKEAKGLTEGRVKTEIKNKNYSGFVFVSFGSFVKISSAPASFLQIFYQAFEKFPKIKFLWKWEGDLPKNLPKNIFMQNWFPQQELLAHPKCQGFITQGGLMSIQQSIFHAVPIIVIPFLGDQPMNARLSMQNGNGIHLEPSELTVEILESSVHQIIYTDRFSKRVKEMSNQFTDRPMTPVNTAVWWTEYVVRNSDLSRLKPRQGLHWWERRMLHFWALIFLTILIVLAVIIITIIFVVRCSCRLLGFNDRCNKNKIEAIKKPKQGKKTN